MTDSSSNKLQRIGRTLVNNSDTLSAFNYDQSTNTVKTSGTFSKTPARIVVANAASIVTDCSLGNSFYIDLDVTSTRVLANPINVVPGVTYTWVLDHTAATSGLTFGANFKFAAAAPSSSVGAAEIDFLTARAATDGSADLYTTLSDDVQA